MRAGALHQSPAAGPDAGTVRPEIGFAQAADGLAVDASRGLAGGGWA
jgi:hypothetical protein